MLTNEQTEELDSKLSKIPHDENVTGFIYVVAFKKFTKHIISNCYFRYEYRDRNDIIAKVIENTVNICISNGEQVSVKIFDSAKKLLDYMNKS